MTTKIDPVVLAKIMLQARTKVCDISATNTILVSGDHSQYLPIAMTLADFINEFDVEARAVALYILDDKVKPSSIEAVLRWPPSRVLP